MGIVNVTEDSFSDGGRHLAPEAAIAHARRLIEDGADLLDVGGESTRPGAVRVDRQNEAARVIPLVRSLAGDGVMVSVDTMRASTASEALDNGASLINDVSGGLADPEMLTVVAERRCPVILMHWVSPDDYSAGAGGRVDRTRTVTSRSTWSAKDPSPSQLTSPTGTIRVASAAFGPTTT